jgi:hypothetical protein
VVPSARPNSPAAALIPELTAAGGTVTAFTNKDAHNGSEARSDSDAGDPLSLSLSRGSGRRRVRIEPVYTPLPASA